MPSSPLALLGLRFLIIVSISCSVQFISERELSVSFKKGGNWVCLSFTVEIEANSHSKNQLCPDHQNATGFHHLEMLNIMEG